MDLTEHAGAKINRLGEACLKNNLITASNGSLVSTGELTVVLAISFDDSRNSKIPIIMLLEIKKKSESAQNSSLTGSGDSEMSEEQKKEKLSELRKKEHEIQDILARKTKELKKICLREAVREHFLFRAPAAFCTTEKTWPPYDGQLCAVTFPFAEVCIELWLLHL